MNNYDFFCVIETHLDETDIVDIDNYVFFVKHCSQNYKRKSGGVGLYVTEIYVKYVKILSSDTDYIFWVSIDKYLFKSSEDIILGFVYLPPENSRF